MNCDGFDSDDFKFGNCLMLHGTSFECSRKILNEGYKNSAYGYFGKGVYMTESIDIAMIYSIRKTLNNWKKPFCGRTSMKTYFFVNQVLESKSLKIEKYKSYHKLNNNYAALKHPFCKHMHQDSPDRKVKIDSKGRLHSNKKIPGLSLADEYVADKRSLKPRFLIVIEPSGLDYEKYLEYKKFLLEKKK